MRPRLVVKLGSSTVLGAEGEPRRSWLKGLAAELRELREQGHDIVLVSSGAIALGARHLGLAGSGRRTLEDAQAAAAVGQIALAALWRETLGAAGSSAAQVLLTLDDLDDRRRYLNARATLTRLLDLGVVPIVNENDTVATSEIRFGDNDRLAARVTVALGAATCLLLSDVDGLYDRPPHEPDARRMAVVDDIAAVTSLAGPDSGSGIGTGGMRAKLAAAQIAGRGGAELIVGSGKFERPVGRLLRGEGGTRFLATGTAGGRLAWLAGKARLAGQLLIDGGAVAALRQGASLLPAGIVTVTGSFARGDAVEVLDRTAPVARGLVEYGADDLRRIAGLQRERVAAMLGEPPRTAAIHRDNLVLL